MMRDASWLDWPFFDDAHRKLAHEVDGWCEGALADVDHHDADAACRKLVKAMGQAGWLRYAVAGGPGGAWGGALPEVCLLYTSRRWATSRRRASCRWPRNAA